MVELSRPSLVRAGVDCLPNGWEVVELQALVDPERPITYGVVKPGDASVNGVKLIRGGDVHHGRIRRRLRTIDEKTSRQYRRTLLRGGEIVVSLVGFPGQSAIVPRQLAGANLARQVGLVAITDFELTRYVHQYIQSDLGQLILLHPLAGSAQQVVNLADLRTLPVLLPPSDLRGHIADVGEAFDRAVRLLDRLINAKGRLRDGLAQALLTGRRRLPAFAGRAWREARIGEVMQEVHRPVEWDDDAVYDLVSVRRWAGGVYTRQQLRGGEIKVKKLRRIQSGDILISHIQSPYGAMAMVGDDHDGHCVSDLYSVLVPRRGAKIEPRYFAWLCRTRWMWHQAYVSSNGFLAERLRVNFDPATFLDRVIRIPDSTDEQIAIADILDAATREIDVLSRLREAVAKQKRGLMQQLLKGRLPVPEVSDA